MIVASLPLDQQWKVALNIEHRRPPDLFESADEVSDTLNAPAVRTGLNELGLAAVFCVNRVPTIAIRRTRQYAPADVRQIYGALWNQGLATVYVDITDHTVRVFSLARAFAGTDVRRLEAKCLIEALNATTSALQEDLHGIVTGVETGRIWHDNPDYFRPDERIDAVLLNNLSVAHHQLMKFDLPTEQAQAALIQTKFIAYLEDRDIINRDYLNRATLDRYDTWADILGAADTDATERLFAELRNTFNGDLFIGPCSFSEEANNQPLLAEHLRILESFRIGKEEMSENGVSQLRFWATISAIFRLN